MGNCPNCSKEIIQIDNRRPKVYCDDKCRGLHWRMAKSATKNIGKVEVKIEKKPKEKAIDFNVRKSDWMIDLLS